MTASRPCPIPAGGGTGRSAPKPEPATFSAPPDGPPRRLPSRNYLDKKDTIKVPKTRHNGKFLVFDPKEKVMMESNEAMSKKEVSSKKIEDKISLRNTEHRISSKSIENKDNLTNRLSDIWSSSFIREITGEEGQDTGLATQEKISEYCHQDIDDKSESTEEDEDDPNDEDDKGNNPKKEIRAPLKLMAEFLRAEMCRDYQLAKKLCQMILIYEPENPVAKQFLSLIEEILLKERAQNVEEEDDEDSEEDSEEESSEDGSDNSTDECADGS